MSFPATGLFVHRGSRIERLAQTLARRIDDERPANPLTPQTIVVAHAGLGRWLLGEFSRHPAPRGGHGIAANFRMLLPWEWLDRLARETLGDAALIGGPWRHDVLRWQILAALPAIDAPEIRSFTAGEDAARRSFQLADHLAGVYTQYLVYRPEWIEAWERADAATKGDWQAILWRHVQRAVGKPHRAQRRKALLDALARAHVDTEPPQHAHATTRDDAAAQASSAPAALHVFGISQLAPDVLDTLRACCLQRAVHLYFPDPCREHWSYLRTQRALLRSDSDPLAMYLEVGHPLLVALGRVAQDFCLTLDEMDANEDRDPLDEDESPCWTAPLLDRVQSSIRCLQPDALGADLRARLDRCEDENKRKEGRASLLAAARNDASLRVHACHTRLRELEVLKDAVLRHLADDPTLAHRDIVVMAPDIGAYAPYLAAVFGEPARYRSDPRHVPWHLADVGLAHAHPLMGAFARLLDLAESRFRVSDVLGLLDVPALARRFAIDAAARETLEHCLRRAHVAWGLDAAMKEQVGAAPVDANSWQFGFDRMYAGLIAGNEGELVDDVLPLAGVAGSAIDAIGQLDRLLGQLRHVRTATQQPRTLAHWSAWLNEQLDALFLVDPRDDDEMAAMDALRRLLADLSEQAIDANMRTAQAWPVVREVLRESLGAVPERQPFLLGGVTFCGLVPQRSIPFRMICLLGMNEGEFPRAGGDGGLNHMRAQPRRGDRDTRNEDRYLFLEALMAARARLHISYIGIGVRDGKSKNPSSVLAELLQFLDEQHAIAVDDDVERPWKIVHPLQPFDARYYERDELGEPRHDPRLFSFDDRFVAAATGRSRDAGRFMQRPARGVAVAPKADMSLDALRRFWREPARHALEREAGIDLRAADGDAWPDREPLEAKVAPLERFDTHLVFDALESGSAQLPSMAPAQLRQSGLLAAGALGERAYADAREGAQQVLDKLRQVLPPGTARRVTQAIDLDLGDDVRLVGAIDRVFCTIDGHLLLLGARPNGCAVFKEWLPFFIDWAALRLTSGERAGAAFVECGGDKYKKKAVVPALLPALLGQDDATLRRGLRRLVELARTAQSLLFFPRTAWVYASTDPRKRIGAARAQWQGKDDNERSTPERDYAPGYARLLMRDIDLFDEQTPEHAAFLAIVTQICAVLDPKHTLLLREARAMHEASLGGADS